ncbi:hypothetical protein GCM10027289_16910 [Tsukamurella serpentis]
MLPALLSALFPIALAGCDSQSDGAAPAPVTAPASTAAPASAVGPADGGPAAPDAGGSNPGKVTSSELSTPIADSPERYNGPGGVYFYTPSRNIGCGITTERDGSLTGCQVFTTTVIPPGARCEGATMPPEKLSKGYLSQRGGPFQPSCFSQGVFSSRVDQQTLPYGHSVTSAGVTCVSETRGVTCRRGDHGFFVSAESFNQW